ncbi:retron St85 family RNA-directed DNA polymerase [Shewanella eurypsychrophilus]|uniref:RNA-directed DNA polymerase n=1 Tax=Shewanella eurypsychrophilus TaxID=2593656 RepID=A0ABX6V1J9_9GAMM|nr:MULTISPECIES: retron St85 family RNA-directed DNA polymerase [Shewanella]QFU21206.1 hypothetical protein FS418_04530 [Shewanella sp. YLB-09]QPG56497.1 retron St85 family RNA-directed DNA polymerase [Shewanella eurypsychrophilus]
MNKLNILNEISNDIDVNIGEFFNFSSMAPTAYSTFQIRKKSGGTREISQPAQWLKSVQYAIIQKLLEQLPIHYTATAYQKGKGIKQNAEAHINKTFILKTDFENFFPSILQSDLELILKRNNIEINSFEYSVISRFLFKKKNDSNKLELCIGAPSSPMISNVVMFEIDSLLSEKCNELDISYTRYADDMTFSSDKYENVEFILEFLKQTILKVESPQLILNNKKTKIISKGRSQRVTGVILSNDGRVSIGRNKRRRARTLLHLLELDKVDDKSLVELYSIVSFMRNIEPEFYEILKEKYGYNLFKKLYKKFSLLVEKHTDQSTGMKLKFKGFNVD